MKSIDFNCDLGEGFGDDAQLMPYLSSCNVACGGHAGDLKTMAKTVELAKQHKVKIGAHPSFPDKKHFGRQVMKLSSLELHQTVTNQITSLIEVMKPYGLKLHHVKPHGALYNLAVTDKKTAQILLDVIQGIDKRLVLYAPYQSMISKMAITNGVKVMYEGFADRNYNDDLTLVSRKNSNAVIHDSNLIFKHVFNMIFNEKVKTINGVEVGLKVDTICLHSDHKNTVKNLKNLILKLDQNLIKVI